MAPVRSAQHISFRKLHHLADHLIEDVLTDTPGTRPGEDTSCLMSIETRDRISWIAFIVLETQVLAKALPGAVQQRRIGR